MKKLGICIPWDSPFVWVDPMISIMNLRIPEGVEVRYFRGYGWCPAARHNRALFMATIWGADHILILGSDQIYPDRDTIIKMAAKLPEWDMVTALMPVRGALGINKKAFAGLAYKLKDNAVLPRFFPLLHYDEKAWDMITEEDESQEIHVVGSGILLFKTSILAGVQMPWFFEFTQKDATYGRIPIQDTHFVFRCTVEAGARLWCDTSIQVYHMDVFTIDWSFQERFKDKTGSDWTPMREAMDDPTRAVKGESHEDFERRIQGILQQLGAIPCPANGETPDNLSKPCCSCEEPPCRDGS